MENEETGGMIIDHKLNYSRKNTVYFFMLIGAFGVRVPVSYFMSRIPDTSLFKIGLATPMSSLVQLVLCLGCYMVILKKLKA